MEIEIKGRELEGIVNSISNIVNKPIQQYDLKQFKLAYRLKRISDSLFSVFKDLDRKRIALVKEYGVEDKQKKTITVAKDKLEIFNKALDIILDSTVKVDIDLIPFDMLRFSGIDINLIELASIERFIDKPKEA